MEMNDIFNLSRHVIVLTGASGLLGNEYAHGLSQAGANLVLADLDYEKCKKLSKHLNKLYNTSSLPIKVDVTDHDSVKNMVKQTIDKFSKINVLVNNAIFSEVNSNKISFEKFPLCTPISKIFMFSLLMCLEIAFANVPAPAAAGESIAIFIIFFLLIIIFLNHLLYLRMLEKKF